MKVNKENSNFLMVEYNSEVNNDTHSGSYHYYNTEKLLTINNSLQWFIEYIM